ncbi:MAG: DUF4080 domain-containing protein [Desulfobulbaceae bacterium]|nr:DUF4080 domain-containing protein [Desulfobulbaceae bacterium]
MPQQHHATYLLISVNCRYSHSCLALYYLRNELEQYLPNSLAEPIQFSLNESYYDTLLTISNHPAKALFFSVYIWNSGYISRLITDLATLQPERPIVLGGPQAPFLSNPPPLCTIVTGEIEGINSSFYQDLATGKLKQLYQANRASSFTFPYHDEDFSKSLQNRYIYYESSRGCPFSCSYCLSSTTKGVTHKDLKTVKKELSHLLATQPKLIKFVDRTFNDNPQRAVEIWQFLAKNSSNTKFHFEIAPDRFTSAMEDFLTSVDLDLFQFEIGIQSTNPDTLAAINRSMDVEAATQTVKTLSALDTIHIHADLILGLPHEDKETFRRSFNQVFNMRPHYLQMGLLKILPTTKISTQTKEFGLIHCSEPPYEILATNWMDHQTLSSLHQFGECVESFYNNRFFRSLWNYLINIEEEPFSFFSSLQTICEANNFFSLATTQKLMLEMLCKMAGNRPDQDLLIEILCYDWLRCGHRFLPDCLAQFSLTETRAELRRLLPQILDNYYDHTNRNEFIKNNNFIKLSTATLREIKLYTGNQSGYVCIFPQKTNGVMKHHKSVLLPIPC